jgi:hypothetical protein
MAGLFFDATTAVAFIKSEVRPRTEDRPGRGAARLSTPDFLSYTSPMTTTPMAPVSWGELLDKITILQIKAERMADAAKRANVVTELTLLSDIAGPALQEVAALVGELKGINEALWDIEDKIRDKELASAFDAEFIALARAVYFTNDRRAAVKRDINRALNSALVEEKSYKPYAPGAQ